MYENLSLSLPYETLSPYSERSSQPASLTPALDLESAHFQSTEKPPFQSRFPRRFVFLFGILQLLSGLVVFLFEFLVFEIAIGFWCGAIYIFAALSILILGYNNYDMCASIRIDAVLHAVMVCNTTATRIEVFYLTEICAQNISNIETNCTIEKPTEITKLIRSDLELHQASIVFLIQLIGWIFSMSQLILHFVLFQDRCMKKINNFRVPLTVSCKFFLGQIISALSFFFIAILFQIVFLRTYFLVLRRKHGTLNLSKVLPVNHC